MRKTDLVKQLCTLGELNRVQADDVVEAIVEQVTNALARGERVQLPGLGSFAVRHRKAHTGINPQTGEALRIAAKNQIFFKAGKRLRDPFQHKE